MYQHENLAGTGRNRSSSNPRCYEEMSTPGVLRLNTYLFALPYLGSKESFCFIQGIEWMNTVLLPTCDMNTKCFFVHNLFSFQVSKPTQSIQCDQRQNLSLYHYFYYTRRR